MFFGRIFSKKSSSAYDSILQDDHESRIGDVEVKGEVKGSRLISVGNLGWVFFAIGCLLHLTHWYFLRQTLETRCYDDDILHVPTIWEEQTFLSNIYGQEYDIYSQDNPNVEDAWRSILFPHLIRITASEMSHLPAGQETAEARDGDGYVVVTGVFHQLHCLNSLRKAFFDEEKSQNLTDAEGHIDHCFSYLLQTLLCHADVGSMTTRWDELEGVYQANFNVTRTCRSYDAVREWAEGRKI